MEDEDFIELPASGDSRSGSGGNEDHNSDTKPSSVDLQNTGSVDDEIQVAGEKLGNSEGEGNSTTMGVDCTNLVESRSVLQVDVELNKTITVTENSSSKVTLEDGSQAAVHDVEHCRVEKSTLSGMKRPRMMDDEEHPTVRVIYNSLTRASRQKLEELMQQWSEWDALQGSSSQDSDGVKESGEKTYFPALRVGVEKSSAVSFWIESKLREEQESIQLDEESTPLYDRGYALGLISEDRSTTVGRNLEIIDDPARCFNCGSYSHSMRECPKPRDDVAVNKARDQFKLKKNQNAGPRNSSRYYQSTPAGKYDGLRPGALDPETRQLLGIGELDPPPWLNRMRELGYPPGYLDVDDEDQPSGITIYDDEQMKEETEEGEMLDAVDPERRTRKTVEYPGINAPIPENADKFLWESGPPSSSSFRNQPYSRLNHEPDVNTRGHHRDQRWHSRDFRDDGPPGCDPVSSSYPPRYGDHTSWTYPRSSSYDRGYRSPVVYDDSESHGSHSHERWKDHRYDNHETNRPPDGDDRHDWTRHRRW